MEMQFEKQSFWKHLKSILKADVRRMFTTPLVYIAAGVSFVMPILILVMTSLLPAVSTDPVTGAEQTTETFTNVWQSLGAVSGGSTMSMDLTGMCNINLLYFLAAIFACIFVSEDFRSGYAKNLFAVRPKKTDYVTSKTVVLLTGTVIMFLLYFIGTLIGGAIAGLSFSTAGFGAGGVAACFISKIFMTAVFVSIALLLSVAAKQRLWLSILCSIAACALLFAMLPIAAPLDSSLMNIALCFAGGAAFAVGLGAVSSLILNKTNLV